MSAQIEEFYLPDLTSGDSVIGGTSRRHLKLAQKFTRQTDIRDSILVAAESLVDETDQWTWSIREICDEALVPYNAFHRTLQKKSVLVDELTTRWHRELVDFIGMAEGLELFERHLAWLSIHRRRIQFLIAEAGVLDGSRSLSRNVEILMPSVRSVSQALGLVAPLDSRAMRKALSSSIFLIGYLSGYDSIRDSWSTAVGFPRRDFIDSLSTDGHNDRVQEFMWVRNSYAILMGKFVDNVPIHPEVELALVNYRSENLTAIVC